jgi:hypothetical protein
MGHAPISPGLARRVLGRFRLGVGTGTGLAWAFPQRESTYPLNDAEAGILRGIAQGVGVAQVGAWGTNPQPGVRAQGKQIYRKLAAHARGDRVADAEMRDIQLVALGSACDRQVPPMPARGYGF